MGKRTEISWAHSTQNFWRGCVEAENSPACDHCYAKRMSLRNPKVLGTWGTEGVGVRVVGAPSYWNEPLEWNKAAEAAGERRRVFTLSYGDFFEDWTGPMTAHNGCSLWRCDTCGTWHEGAKLPIQVNGPSCCGALTRPLSMNDVRVRAFGVMKETPWLDWLVLTKRPQNIRRMWVPLEEHYAPPYVSGGEIVGPDYVEELHRPNVWLGCTVENQEQAERRIAELAKCRDLAPVRFLSCEPLLSTLDLSRWLAIEEDRDGSWRPETKFGRESEINWVITGGESGSQARPSHPRWFRALRDQCEAAHVPFHHKQNGEFVHVDDAIQLGLTTTYDGKFQPYDHSLGVPMLRVGVKNAGRLLDGVLHDAVPGSEAIYG